MRKNLLIDLSAVRFRADVVLKNTIMFYHDFQTLTEFYVIKRMQNGMFQAVCTRENSTYYLGQVNYFQFTDRSIWSRGKLKGRADSLTIA